MKKLIHLLPLKVSELQFGIKGEMALLKCSAVLSTVRKGNGFSYMRTRATYTSVLPSSS